jgi:excisionase family DNA binding protein
VVAFPEGAAMNRQPQPRDEYLTPAAVAAIFFVDPKTVTRWATAGKLPAIRTPGGHHRFLKSDVMALLDPVHAAAAGHLTVPGLAEAAPGSPAASAAAMIAEAAALALEAEAHAAGDAALLAASVLQGAHAEATRTASDARQARILATVHAAYADSVANGWGPRDSGPVENAPLDEQLPLQTGVDER